MLNQVITSMTKSTILFSLLVLALGVNYIYAEWSDAPDNPPNSNVATPINVSGTEQTKSGNLNITGALDVLGGVSAGSLLITNNSAFVGDVGIGTTTPGVPLDVNGVIRTQTQVHANEYCDENGSNCFTATSVGTSTAGWDYISKKDHPGDGNFVTFITGFSGSPANVEVDLVAKGSECGYDVGDVIYNVGSTNNTTSDRNHDEGMVVAGDSSGLIAIKISARGLSVIRVDNIFYAWDDCQLTPSNWSVVVKADEGDIH